MEIGKINIDFCVIPDFEPSHIVIGDLSQWFQAENLPATISIIPPGSTKAINNTFQKHKLNIFNSTNLGLTCVKECDKQDLVDLPDGIYTITVLSGYEGIDKTRYYLKTDVFQLALDAVYVRAGLEYDKNQRQFREDLQDIHFLVNASHSYVRTGDFSKANKCFTEAQLLLKKYYDCKDCL